MRNMIIVATTLVPTAALAGGYALPNESARDLALSQSAIADQDGPEALFLNPSALAGPVGFAVSGSLELLDNRTDYSDPNLGPASTQQANFPTTTAVSYGDKLSNGMGWGVGLGLTVPFGGALKWPTNWAGEQFIQTVKQEVFELGFGAAIQPLSFLRIGATYLRYQSTEEFTQGIDFLDHFGPADLGLCGGENLFGVAAHVDIPEIPLSIAANYRHSATIDLSRNAHFEDVPAAFVPMIHDQKVTAEQALPNAFDVGAAYAVIPNLKVMFDYTFERWSVYHQDSFIGADGFTVTVPRNYNNAHVFRLGAEWRSVSFMPALTLRVGGLASRSNQPTDTVSPTLTDGNSWAFSVGGGLDVLKNLRLDIAWQHAFFDSVTATGPETLPGTYKTQVDLISRAAFAGAPTSGSGTLRPRSNRLVLVLRCPRRSKAAANSRRPSSLPAQSEASTNQITRGDRRTTRATLLELGLCGDVDR